MTRRPIRTVTLIGAVLTGLAVVVCVFLLLLDYARYRVQLPSDEQRITELQELVQTDASHAARLAEEQTRLSDAQQARRARADRISIWLIASTALFLTLSKSFVALKPRQPINMERLVQLKLPAMSRGDGRLRSAGHDWASPAEQELEAIVAQIGASREDTIVLLQAIQSRFGYLPAELLQRVCEKTEITPAQIAGVSTFYERFRHTPMGRHFVRVCQGTACHVAGAQQISEEIRRRFEIPPGDDTDNKREFTVDSVACLGCCSLAPVMMVDEHTVGRLTPAHACDALHDVQQEQPA
jgi:NADH:ubiquinone oxidoreductase subunit E